MGTILIDPWKRYAQHQSLRRLLEGRKTRSSSEECAKISVNERRNCDDQSRRWQGLSQTRSADCARVKPYLTLDVRIDCLLEFDVEHVAMTDFSDASR